MMGKMENSIFSNRVNWTFLLFIVFLSEALPIDEAETTLSPNLSPQESLNLNVGLPSQADQELSPLNEKKEDGFGLTEVKEDDLPEDSVIYVSVEQEDEKVDGETLKTASNLVFRPLFRYKGKQEALTRVPSGNNRRYYVPKTYYRPSQYPYYYRQRYY